MSATNRPNATIFGPSKAECADRVNSWGAAAFVRWRVRPFVAVFALMITSCTSVEELKGRSCNNPPDPDAGISACTYAIQSGHLTAESVAVAYNNRGLAYFHKGDLGRAIQDYDESLRLNPNVLALNNISRSVPTT